MLNANRLDPGQPPSNSAAGLRSNLFATQFIIPHKNKQNLKVLKSRRRYYLFLENYPVFKGLTLFLIEMHFDKSEKCDHCKHERELPEDIRRIEGDLRSRSRSQGSHFSVDGKVWEL